MKRIVSAAVCLLLAVFGAVLLSGNLVRDYPEGVIYNYFERAQSGAFIALDDYFASVKGGAIYVFDKNGCEKTELAESAFDIKKPLAFFLGSSGNTLYYMEMNPITRNIGCCSFELDSYEKSVIALENAVSNTAGFLGMDSVLGLTLGASSAMSVAGNKDSSYINSSGVHNASERSEYLRKYDGENKYGVNAGVSKIAECDRYIFFINCFYELYRFDKREKEFLPVTKRSAADFFITEDTVYFVSAEQTSAMYSCSYSGENEKFIGNISPDSVKICKSLVYVSQGKEIFLVGASSLVKAGSVSGACWYADGENIYEYTPETGELSSKPLIVS